MGSNLEMDVGFGMGSSLVLGSVDGRQSSLFGDNSRVANSLPSCGSSLAVDSSNLLRDNGAAIRKAAVLVGAVGRTRSHHPRSLYICASSPVLRNIGLAVPSLIIDVLSKSFACCRLLDGCTSRCRSRKCAKPLSSASRAPMGFVMSKALFPDVESFVYPVAGDCKRGVMRGCQQISCVLASEAKLSRGHDRAS